MSHNLNFNLKYFTIELSQATIDAFLAHKSFCSAGTDWLVEHDPYGKIEQEYIEKVHQSFQVDLDHSIDELRSELMECVSNSTDNWWGGINNLLNSN